MKIRYLIWLLSIAAGSLVWGCSHSKVQRFQSVDGEVLLDVHHRNYRYRTVVPPSIHSSKSKKKSDPNVADISTICDSSVPDRNRVARCECSDSV